MIARVAILCAKPRSVYHELAGCDVFDAVRDAWTFTGGSPVVAHPPFRLFGKLKHFAKSEDAQMERLLAEFCVDQVRRCGGVLEHPAGSSLWKLSALPAPGAPDEGEGFTVEIPQFWFGHLGEKNTWLFISGCRRADLPAIPLRLDNQDRRPVENLSHRQRAATPRALAEWLVEVARTTTRTTALSA